MTSSAIAAAVMIASAAVTTICAAVLWRRRSLVGAQSLAVASSAVCVWSLLYAAELLVPDLEVALLLGDLKYLGIVVLPPAWMVFALRYTGRGHLVTRRLLAALAIHPVAMVILLALPATHDLVRGGGAHFSPGGFPVVPVGWLFWVHFAYAWGVLALATALIGWSLLRTSRVYLRESLSLGAALSVPWLASVLFNRPGTELLVDPTPTAYAVVQVAFVWGVLRFGLFNLAPIARSTVVDALDDAVIVVDPYERIVDLNVAAERLLGTTRRAAAGELFAHHLPDHVALIRTHRPSLRRDVTLVRDREVVDFEVTVSRTRAGSALLPGHVLVLHDVTARRRAQRRMEHLVRYDQLTDLANRMLFTDRLEQALALARRSGDSVAVLFVDLDGFKTVNDSHGHDVGDVVLRETAARLTDCLRESDTAARMGGDEFLIVLPAIDTPAAASAVAGKVLDAISQPFTAAGTRLHLSASIGIAVAPPQPLDATLLTRMADTAMYRAKAAGKNCYAFADSPPGEGLEPLRRGTEPTADDGLDAAGQDRPQLTDGTWDPARQRPSGVSPGARG